MHVVIEFLVATMNRSSLEFLDGVLANVNLEEVRVLVVNQCTQRPHVEFKVHHPHVRVISVFEVGLSRSRNLAIEHAVGDICVIVDDDCVLAKGCVDEITREYRKHPHADVLVFGVLGSASGCPRGWHPRRVTPVRRFSVFRVSSVGLTFRRRSVLAAGLSFDLRFGLGAIYPVGEEGVFVSDALERKLRALFVPGFVSLTEEASTGASVLDKPELRGAVFQRVARNRFELYLAVAYTSIVKYRRYRKGATFLQYVRRMIGGASAYRGQRDLDRRAVGSRPQ